MGSKYHTQFGKITFILFLILGITTSKAMAGFVGVSILKDTPFEFEARADDLFGLGVNPANFNGINWDATALIVPPTGPMIPRSIIIDGEHKVGPHPPEGANPFPSPTVLISPANQGVAPPFVATATVSHPGLAPPHEDTITVIYRPVAVPPIPGVATSELTIFFRHPNPPTPPVKPKTSISPSTGGRFSFSAGYSDGTTQLVRDVTPIAANDKIEDLLPSQGTLLLTDSIITFQDTTQTVTSMVFLFGDGMQFSKPDLASAYQLITGFDEVLTPLLVSDTQDLFVAIDLLDLQRHLYLT